MIWTLRPNALGSGSLSGGSGKRDEMIKLLRTQLFSCVELNFKDKEAMKDTVNSGNWEKKMGEKQARSH